MNKILLLLLSILVLAGCKTVEDTGNAGVVPVRIPNPPAELIQKAKPLPELTDPTMGALVIDGVQSDMEYNAVGTRYNKLIDWTLCVVDSVNNKKDINECLNT